MTQSVLRRKALAYFQIPLSPYEAPKSVPGGRREAQQLRSRAHSKGDFIEATRIWRTAVVLIERLDRTASALPRCLVVSIAFVNKFPYFADGSDFGRSLDYRTDVVDVVSAVNTGRRT